MTSTDIYAILESKPHNPHYLRRYWNFIQSCSTTSEYTEKHHICPKSKDLFPEYSSFKLHNWNKIKLSARQHFIAHWMLWKAFGRSQGHAFNIMSNKTGFKINSSTYKLLKENRVKMIKEEGFARRKPKEIRTYICHRCGKSKEKLEYVHNEKLAVWQCNSCANSKPSKLKGKILPHLHGRTSWNKGLKCPQLSGENNGMNHLEQRKRQSELAKRRRKQVLPDGSWKWRYID
jgi:ribosomal protein L37AE/L43A